ncbi:MAG: hypothetical protein AAFY48_00785 [Bacteroidota bacterium]
MITEINNPELVSMCRQPMRIAVTSNLATEERIIHYLRLAVTGSPTVGDTIVITYGDVSETFTVQTAADDSGNTISVQGTLSNLAYAQLLVQEFNRNYALFTSFEIEHNSGADEFVQIQPRVDRTQEWTVDNNLDNIDDEILTGGPSGFQPNPGLVLLVEKFDGTNYERPIEHSLPLIESGLAVSFDIQSDFDLRHHLPPTNTISSSGNYFTFCTDNIQRYRFSYAERSGRPSRVQGLFSDKQDYFALYGTNSFFSQYEDFWTYWKDNGRFLTTQKNRKKVVYNQPEWLYWIGRQFGNMFLRITATQRSGVVTAYTRGTAAVSLGDVVAIQTGYDQLNLPDNPTDPIVKYTVELLIGGTTVSEVFEYTITGNNGGPERFFLFGNSLGGCDTVRATGKFVTQLEIEGQDAERIVDEDVIADGRGAFYQYDVRGTGGFQGSVGYKSAEYIAYLQELLLSPEVWVIDTASQRFNPIRIDRGSVSLFKDGDDLFTLKFNYRHNWQDRGLGVTDNGQRIILPDTPPDEEIGLGG